MVREARTAMERSARCSFSKDKAERLEKEKRESTCETTEKVWDIARRMTSSGIHGSKRKKPFKILLAVDAYEYTIDAFECKYLSLFTSSFRTHQTLTFSHVLFQSTV